MSNKYSQTTILLFKMMIQLVLITLTSTKMKSETLILIEVKKYKVINSILQSIINSIKPQILDMIFSMKNKLITSTQSEIVPVQMFKLR